MHLDPPGQERAHRALMRDALRSAGLRDIAVDAWHPCPDGLADFRHIVKVGVGRNDHGKVKVGAWGRGTRRVVPIPKCVVAAPILNKTMVSLAHYILELDIWPYEPDTGKGTLRHAILRASRTTGEVMITLVAGRSNRMLRELAEAVTRAVSEVVGVWLHLNDQPGNALYDRDDYGVVRCLPLQGKGELTEEIGGIRYQIGPGDFFQTNPSVAALVYQRTLDVLDPGADDVFVDLYSGVGGLALQAARRGAGFVVGVEEIDGAVQRARAAARSNRLNAEFTLGRVDQVGPDLEKRLDGTRPLIAVNPARRGLEDGVVEQIAAFKPRRVAYISCNPTALARDLAQFVEAGFTPPRGLELFDMFPNTPHVECLAVLEGPAGEGPARRAPRRKVVRRR